MSFTPEMMDQLMALAAGNAAVKPKEEKKAKPEDVYTASDVVPKAEFVSDDDEYVAVVLPDGSTFGGVEGSQIVYMDADYEEVPEYGKGLIRTVPVSTLLEVYDCIQRLKNLLG